MFTFQISRLLLSRRKVWPNDDCPLYVDPVRSLSSRNEIGFSLTERLIEWVAPAAC